jgi:hypothetical protein
MSLIGTASLITESVSDWIQAESAQTQSEGGSLPQTTSTWQQIKNWLCHADSDEPSALDAASDIGTGADNTAMLLDTAAAATFTTDTTPLSAATTFLASEAASGISLIGKSGQVAAAFSFLGNIYSGKTQAGVYGAVDFAFYASVSRAAVTAAGPSRGTSIGLGVLMAATYYSQGGSKGLVQGTICP